MAISKRLRFEILRRDNYTCRYCGQAAPDIALTVDHVVPSALGGADDPENLVAACADCNSGKTSSMPDAPLVAAVANDAARWAAAMKQAVEENQMNDNTAVYEAVVSAWTSYRRTREIPTDYRETIDQIYSAGLPVEDIVKMARVADAKTNVQDRWAYFCGCCWNRVRQLQERAQQIFVDTRPSDPEPTASTQVLMPARREAIDPAERQRSITRWFKPIWYGEALEAGYRRWGKLNASYIDEARLQAIDLDLGPDDNLYVNDKDEIRLTDAPRPNSWIDIVSQFLDSGLSKPDIEESVRRSMREGVQSSDLWHLFTATCRARIHEIEESEPDG